MRQLERDFDLVQVILADAQVLASCIRRFAMTEDKFVNDRSEEGELAYDAIMSPVFRISEDALRLSAELMSMLPDHPWDNMRGLRSFVAHGYREVDRAIAWKVSSGDIPRLARLLKSDALEPLFGPLSMGALRGVSSG